MAKAKPDTTPEAKTTGASKRKFDVLVGCEYPPSGRHRPGEVVDDVPANVVAAWVAEGVIAEHEGA